MNGGVRRRHSGVGKGGEKLQWGGSRVGGGTDWWSSASLDPKPMDLRHRGS